MKRWWQFWKHEPTVPSDDTPHVFNAMDAANKRVQQLVKDNASEAEIGAALFELATITASLALRLSNAPNLLASSTLYVDEPDAAKRRISVVARYVVGRSPDEVINELRRDNDRLRGLVDHLDGYKP